MVYKHVFKLEYLFIYIYTFEIFILRINIISCQTKSFPLLHLIINNIDF